MPTRTENIGPCGCCISDLGPCDPLCDGGASRSIGSGFPPMSPGCAFLVGNDFYDLVNGAAGVTPGGIVVSISGASDFRQITGAGGAGTWSADMGDEFEWIVVTSGGGPNALTSLSMCIDFDTMSDGTDNFRCVIGWTDEWIYSGVGASAIVFVHDRTVYGDNNWRAITRTSSTSTTTDTGVASVAGTPRHLQILTDDLAQVRFVIDGTVVATNTTNIPAANTSINMRFSMIKTAGTNNRYAYMMAPNYFMEW